MSITKKLLMGGDKMVRPGGVKTMQDEINEGLRDKDGRLYTPEQLENNKNASAQAAEETTQDQGQSGGEDQGADGGESSQSDQGSESAGDATPGESGEEKPATE